MTDRLDELLAGWKGELERVIGMRRSDIEAIPRTTAMSMVRYHRVHEEIVRAWQPIVGYMANKIIEIERLRPQTMIIPVENEEEA